jgi:all-trans-8'-apo-beta-carotenal 15,15'-oxygenase
MFTLFTFWLAGQADYVYGVHMATTSKPLSSRSAPQPPRAATTVAAPSAALTLDLWSKDLPREHGFEPLTIEGRLPPSLRGTLFRNGPAQFGGFGRRYSHAFEADGGITAVRIADGKASGASRVTQSAGLVQERAAGKPLFSSNAPWLTRLRHQLGGRSKNTANTSVMMWQGRLFALMEGGKPTEIDPRDLATIGETDLGAVTSMFSAHPHRVDSRRAIYNFGLSYGKQTLLHLYELPDDGAARKLSAIPLPAAVMLHDFIATDTHLVFFIAPARISLPRAILAVGGIDQMFQWKPEHGTEILCVPIDRPTEPVRFTVEAFYQWHFANAYRHGGELIIDYVRYPNFDSFQTIAGYARGEHGGALKDGRYHRARIDLAARSLTSEPIADRSCEFPTVTPGEYGMPHERAFVAFDELGAIGAIDARGAIVAHELPADERASEPLYVDGHLLALCHGHDRAYVAVYDAARIPDGPVAKIHIDHHVPLTFHGTFARAPAVLS